MSRNIVIDDKVVGQICYAVSKGVTLASACERVGVSYDVIRQYVTSGRKALAEGKSNRNAEIAKKIGQSRAMFEGKAVDRIVEASEDITDSNGRVIQRGQWGALGFILERTMPEKWGQKINIQVQQAKQEMLDVVEKNVNANVQGVLARKILAGIYEDLMECDSRRETG